MTGMQQSTRIVLKILARKMKLKRRFNKISIAEALRFLKNRITAQPSIQKGKENREDKEREENAYEAKKQDQSLSPVALLFLRKGREKKRLQG